MQERASEFIHAKKKQLLAWCNPSQYLLNAQNIMADMCSLTQSSNDQSVMYKIFHLLGIAVYKIKLDNYNFNRPRIYKTKLIVLLAINYCSECSVKANLRKVNMSCD